jgi:23S rRNA maturation mini-RNase III
MERRIIHTRSAAIIKREKRRGNLDSETAMQVRAAINPMTAKRLALEELTPEEKADRRRAQQAEYKRTRRSKGRA